MKRIGGTFENVGFHLTTGEPRDDSHTLARDAFRLFLSGFVKASRRRSGGLDRSYGFYHSEMERNEMAIAHNYEDILEDTLAMLLNI
jgi:hypothetical protein